MNFYTEIQKILEGFNVYPKARAVQGRQAPVPSTNVNSVGPQPMGFKGSGPIGIGPSAMSTVLLELPKKKKKKFKKKK
jgi:hypothetical protein